jgi:hypothetical protein
MQAPTHVAGVLGKELSLSVKRRLKIMSMKAMMGVVIALTTALASPAFAKTAASRHDLHNAYGRQIQIQDRQQAWAHRSSNVYVDGRYVGSDPDPFIRDQLARDPGQGGNVW